MDAFEELYIKYRQDIYRFICKLTDYNLNLSEELLSETFYQAFLSFGRFRGECEIKTWLCQIAKNTYSTYIRKEISKKHLCDRLKNVQYTEDMSECKACEEYYNALTHDIDIGLNQEETFTSEYASIAKKNQETQN